jgi:uncharacterized protein
MSKLIKFFLISLLILGLLTLAYVGYQKLTSSPAKLFSKLELADTEQKREYGLMNRPSLCSDCGMLFSFPSSNTYSFWMKNTKIPLDIIYIQEGGKIDSVCYNMQPEDIKTNCSAKTPVKYVVETNPDYFKSKNLQEGSMVDIKELIDTAK